MRKRWILITRGMKLYWVSAYTLMWGSQFGCTIWAHNEEELWQNFEEKYPDSDVADWGIW